MKAKQSPTARTVDQVTASMSSPSQSAEIDSLPFLLKLPPELLGFIAAYVLPDDLPNSRLAFKGLCTASTSHFGHKRLAYRRFLFTRYSLSGLVDLAAHPVFGRCIKAVSFSTSWDLPKQRAFIESKEHIRLISRAMRNLKKHDNHVRIGVFDEILNFEQFPRYTMRRSTVRHAYGSAERGEQGKKCSVGLDSPRVAQTLNALNRAATRSGFPLKCLTLDLDKTSPLWDTMHEYSTEEEDEEDEDGENSLEDNDLEVDDVVHRILFSNDESFKHDIDVDVKSFMDSAIRINLNQKRFDFRNPTTEYPTETATLGNFWRSPMELALRLENIRHMCFKNCRIEPLVFTGFLSGYSRSLRTLELIFIDLASTVRDGALADSSDTDCTTRLLRFLKDSMRLEEIVLHDIFSTDHNAYVVKESRCWQGKEAIALGLDGLVVSVGNWNIEEAVLEKGQRYQHDTEEEEERDWRGIERFDYGRRTERRTKRRKRRIVEKSTGRSIGRGSKVVEFVDLTDD